MNKQNPIISAARATTPAKKSLIILTSFSLLALSGHAAVITGKVINQNTQRFLERAVVQVQGTQFQALTEKRSSTSSKAN